MSTQQEEPTKSGGHRNPPKKYQFKPGQSGNPNGRPTKRRKSDLGRSSGLNDGFVWDVDELKIEFEELILADVPVEFSDRHRDCQTARCPVSLQAGVTTHPFKSIYLNEFMPLVSRFFRARRYYKGPFNKYT